MENASKRTFDQLNTDEKVKAILGTVYEPVSRELALDFAGVNYDSLSETQQIAIDAVFNSDEVERTEDEDSKYTLSQTGRDALGVEVDITSVHKRIADKMWGDLGLDDL